MNRLRNALGRSPPKHPLLTPQVKPRGADPDPCSNLLDIPNSEADIPSSEVEVSSSEADVPNSEADVPS